MAKWLLRSTHHNRPLTNLLTVLLVLLAPTAAWQAERAFGPEAALIPMIWFGTLALIWVQRTWTLVYTLMAGVMVAMALLVLDLVVRLGL